MRAPTFHDAGHGRGDGSGKVPLGHPGAVDPGDEVDGLRKAERHPIEQIAPPRLAPLGSQQMPGGAIVDVHDGHGGIHQERNLAPEEVENQLAGTGGPSRALDR